MIKWTAGLWIVAMLCLCACGPRPTGIAVTVQASESESVQVRIVELYESTESQLAVFVERDTVGEGDLAAGETFEVQVRPGHYVVKVLGAGGDVAQERKVIVKRNRMTRVEFELR